MAKSPPSKDSAAAKAPPAKAAPPSRTPGSGTRTVTVPGPEDLAHAKEDALLQLRIGRSAHLYTILISAALAVDGILVLLLQPSLPTLASSAMGLSALHSTAYLLIPIAAGLAISLIALQAKWDAFQLWPWEPHFSTTVGAVVANGLITGVYVARIAQLGPFAHLAILPWYYPLALAGIGVAILGLAMTWTSWSPRQELSAVAALLPVATAAFVFVGTPAAAPGSSGLAISLFLSAILIQTSGSLLHLISSGTRPHERELITSGQSKMFHIAEEIRGKEEALQFRMASLVKREADVENAEASVKRQNESLAEARKQLDLFEADYQARSDAVVQKEREWAGKIAEMDARGRLVEDRTHALEVREQELGRRVAALTETESRLEARRKDLEQKTGELLRREGEVASVEGAARPGAASGAKSDIAAREAKLQQFKSALDEQNLVLGRKSRETTEKARLAEEGLKRLAAREGELAAREAKLRQRESDLEEVAKAAVERRTEYEGASRGYTTRLEEVAKLQAEAAQKAADLDRTLKSVADREALVASREQRVQAERASLEERERGLTTRERQLDAGEAEVGLRRIQGSELSIASLAAVANANRIEGDISTRPSRRGAPSRAPSPPPRDLAGEQPTGILRPATGSSHPDRLPTGIPRLDDLLLGGLPPRAHIVLLGDAFVGKEIVLYSFIAEGLKRGEPALLITGSRSPEEVSASLGLVLPQFKEYEQLGMVTWIDASGAGHPATARRIVVAGPSDRAGILQNLVQAAKQVEQEKKSPFRVGFLGLSAIMSGGDAHGGTSFLQNAVGILKLRDALGMYALEGGAIPDAQVEALLGRMDGAILFRQDRDKTFLSVKGVGEVQTHDWVECRATNRTLVVGSFALERIR